jgi:hypothetical protein
MAGRAKRVIQGIKNVLRTTPKDIVRRVWHDPDSHLGTNVSFFDPNMRSLNLARSKPMWAIRNSAAKLAQVQRQTEDKVAQKAISLLERSNVITPRQARRARMGLEMTRLDVEGRTHGKAGDFHSEWIPWNKSGYPLQDFYYSTSKQAFENVSGKKFRNREERQIANAERRLRINSKRDMHPIEYRTFKLTGEVPERLTDKYIRPFLRNNDRSKMLENRAGRAVNELGQTVQDVRYLLRRGGLIGGALGAKALYDQSQKKRTPSGGTNTKKRMNSKYY